MHAVTAICVTKKHKLFFYINILFNLLFQKKLDSKELFNNNSLKFKKEII